MNFEQLKQFVCIVENKTYLEAAEILHMSQSSLSKSIIRLEKELDLKLSDRSKRNVSLTNHGQTFYHDAKILLKDYDLMIKHLTANKKETLILTTLPIINQYRLTPLINQLQDKYQLVINECEEFQIQDEINQKNCDLAIVRENSIDYKNYCSKVIAHDELVVVMSKNHHLANNKGIDFNDLQNESFLCMPKHTYIYQLFNELCLKYHFQPKIMMNARIESLIGSLQSNQGISLLMKKSLLVFNHPNLIYKSLKQPVFSNIVLLYKKSHQELINSLIK